MEILLEEILSVVNGWLVLGDKSAKVCSISTDTRTLRKGDVFIALRGERFDGNEFIEEALAKGASGIITSDKERVNELKEKVSGCWIFLVADTLKAFGDISAIWRRKLPLENLTVIAGSAGKTTTKQMIASVMAGRPDIFISYANYNNLIGVPLNLFRLNHTHRIAVLEIGMNEPGELRRLVQITRPTQAALINIGTAHIGKFGSEDGLLQAKGELLDEISEETLLIYNADCKLTKKLLAQKNLPNRTLTFGINSPADVMATDIKPRAPYGYQFTLKIGKDTVPAELNIFGNYNIENALCATSVLHTLGFGIGKIAEGLRRFQAFSLRSQIEEVNGITLVKDCYNASYTSVILALKSLKEFCRGKGRSIAVLGDMLEQGVFEKQLHRQVGDACLDTGIDIVVTIGERARIISEQIAERGGSSFYFKNPIEAVEFLTDIIQTGDTVLFKASRLLQFEHIIGRFKDSLMNRELVRSPAMRTQ